MRSSATASDKHSGFPPRIHPPRVRFEDLLAVGIAQLSVSVDVALRVVVVVAAFGIDAAYRADDLRRKEDVLDRYHLEQQIDAGLVVDAGVEPDVLQHELFQ